ncbi:complex I assembly factor ACAD9, mitochondrial [Nomia melanderi]|uniref:complex I assembly factor ACAD9, mitochondrial n=1 Tax=Nomia melanderi TaxID=2448451 RepID=UPI0013043619|nr:probable short/branched chain specific acyl-CoA dehydrogenase [Nomia melanderi]
MFARRSLKLKNVFDIRRNFSSEAQPLTSVNLFRFSEKREKLPQRPAFLKHILITDFDSQSVTLPDVQPIDRYNEFETWLTQINSCIQNFQQNPTLGRKELLSDLRDLDVFKAYIDEKYEGLDLLETESLKLTETLSTLPWLGTYVVQNLMLPVQIISKYGSDSQKEKYFPRIISGEIVPTICLKEQNNGTNINHNKMYAVPNDQESWSLNGQKSFVYNGMNANLFLVFAKTDPTYTLNLNTVSLFLVEGNSNGMTCTQTCEIVGRHEMPVFSIHFENTIVPSTNIVGEPNQAFNIMMDLLKPGNQNIAGQSIAILTKFMKHLIPDILEMKHFDRDFYKFDIVKTALADITYALYTMESMAYLTSKLTDFYENQDVELERIITEMYCANKCLSSIQSALQLMGAKIYLNKSIYLDAYHSALALTTLDTNNLDGQIYVATSLVKHIGGSVYDDIYKLRNQHKHPFFSIMKRCVNVFYEASVDIKCFHPSLEIPVGYIAGSIVKMRTTIFETLQRHGTKINDNYSELLRISKMILEIYSMVANVSRVSRSYTAGQKNSNIELNMVLSMTHRSHERITKFGTEIDQDCILNGDEFKKNVAHLIYNERTYPMEHPTHRVY